jgi:hypothetical protein
MLFKYLTEGLIVGLAAWYFPKKKLKPAEILLISLSAMVIFSLIEGLFISVENFQSKSGGDLEKAPTTQKKAPTPVVGPSPAAPGGAVVPGGLRSEILPLINKGASGLSLIQCKKVYNYLVANPLEYINTPKVKKVFLDCEQKIDQSVPHMRKNNETSSVPKVQKKSVTFSRKSQSQEPNGRIRMIPT